MKVCLLVFGAAALSFGPISAWGQTPLLAPPPKLPTVDGNGVDVQSGALQYSQKLMSIGPENEGGLNYTIIYSNGIWRDNQSTQLQDIECFDEPPCSTQSVSIANFSAAFSYSISEMGDGSSLSGSSYIQKDGTQTDFTHPIAGGCDFSFVCTYYFYADSITKPNGLTTTFHWRDDSYGGKNFTRLQSVTTNAGWQLKFNYAANAITDPTGADWLSITSVVGINNAVEYCDPNADTCSVSSSWPQAQPSSDGTYSYWTDARGKTTRFNISFLGFNVKTPDNTGSTDNIAYTQAVLTDGCADIPGGLARKVTTAVINGRTTNYTYPSGPPASVVSSGPLSQTYTSVPAPPGAYPALCRVGVGSMTDPLSRVTTATYDQYGHLLTATPPEGNYISNVIDNGAAFPANNRGNVTAASLYPKTGSASPALTESRTFPTCLYSGANQKTCNQPATYTDPRSHTTTYTYDDAHGGVLTETDPPDTNGINPVKRYAYAQRWAWIKDVSGAYVHSPSQFWVRTEERTCATTATVGSSCAGGASDEIVTSYDYGPDSGPNNLLLRGKVVTSNGVSLRSCYGYDNYGNKMSETSPRAGLTSCP